MRCCPPALLACLLLTSCSVETITYEGRPCATNADCGDGTTCDPASKTCAQPRATDGSAVDRPAPGLDKARPDARRDAKAKPDLKPWPDTRATDQKVAPDGGCGGGKPCGAGLDCVAQTCKCVASGSCKGCCDGNLCRALGSAQSVSKCGAGGAKCASCVDQNLCTSDACLSTGKCQQSYNSASCNDGNACTTNDKCAAGSCKGSSISCNDGISCTSDGCDTKVGCTYKLQPGSCLINKTCYQGGTKHPSATCLQCLPAVSKTSWTPAPGCVTTLAGTGQYGCTDGLASKASFYGPLGLAVDSAGTVYVAENSNSVIRMIKGGVVSVLAGACKQTGSADGPAASARFNSPQDVAVDSSGAVYVADNGNNRIRKIYGGKVTTLAGGAKGYANGVGTSARFDSPQSLVSTPSGTLFVVDTINNRVRKIVGNKVTTLAGSGSFGNKDGPLLQASFSWPHGMAMDATGQLFIVEANRVRKISGSVVSTPFKGKGGCAGLSSPNGCAPGIGGKLFIADYSNHRVQVLSAGKLSNLTGTCGTKGVTDGALSQALFNYPFDLARVGKKLYVSDYQNHRIRLIQLP